MTSPLALHGFGPLKDPESRILILGSFPSLTSRREHFFYMHPQNRFWPLLSAVFSDPFGETSIEEKIRLLKKHGIALYDVLEACEITGSADGSIRNPVPADLHALIEGTRIDRILLNGGKAGSLFQKYFPELRSISIVLPSTSPANARCSLSALVAIWNPVLAENTVRKNPIK